MSMRHLAWAMAQTCETPLDKLVLIHLGDVFDRDAERQSVDVEKIATFCNCSVDLAMRTLAQLSNDAIIRMHMFGEGTALITLAPGRQI